MACPPVHPSARPSARARCRLIYASALLVVRMRRRQRARTQPFQIHSASVSLISPSLPPSLAPSQSVLSPPPVLVHSLARGGRTDGRTGAGGRSVGRTEGDGKSDGSVADNSGASLTLRRTDADGRTGQWAMAPKILVLGKITHL